MMFLFLQFWLSHGANAPHVLANLALQGHLISNQLFVFKMFLFLLKVTKSYVKKHLYRFEKS